MSSENIARLDFLASDHEQHRAGAALAQAVFEHGVASAEPTDKEKEKKGEARAYPALDPRAPGV